MTTAHDHAHDDVAPLLAEYALGTLEPARRERVDHHLAACAACRVDLDELAAAVANLEVAAVPHDAPAPSLADRDALLGAARGTAQHGSGAAPRRRRSSSRRWRSPSWLAAGVASIACMLLALVVVDREGRIDSLERRLADAKGDQVAVLRGASIDTFDVGGAFGDARAQVLLQKDAGVVAFRDVPAPPDGMAWQIWVIDADERIHSIGIVDDARKAAFLPIEDVDPEDVERIIVTTEPIGGSDEPTADEVAKVTV